jgi:uncharacterized protein (DUF433 family)
MKKALLKFHGSVDPREMPAYGIVDASHYLLIPTATLRSWVLGRKYPTQRGEKLFRPVIQLADLTKPRLSFLNLIEAHVLDAIRREHEIPLPKVRIALEYLQKKSYSNHPLADHAFETDGIDLFVEKYGQLINVSQSGQVAMKECLKAYLKRIERDAKGVPIRLYPFTRKRSFDEPRAVVIDPHISFGRPVLAGTGIVTAIIAERYKAGESIADLANDYGRNSLEIEEAIRCELQKEAA